MKLCCKCGQMLEFSMFCKDRQKKDGLSAYCNPCRSATAAKKYAENKEKILARNRKWAESNQEKIRACKASYRAENRDKQLSYAREWRLKNQGRSASYTAKWREKAGNDRVLEDAKRYREANREKTRQASLKWQRENPGLVNAANASRYAAKLKATPKWADLEKIAEFYKEADRLSKIYSRQYDVDHVIPLRSKIVCGLHCEANLRILPADENRSKGNRHWPDMP